MKKHIILLIPFLLLAHITIGQIEKADAVYDRIIREYTLQRDGSTTFREIKQMKLLSHAAFNRMYGETFIVYNPRFQKLTINDSHTVMADGKKVVAPPNSFNEVLPRNAAQSAAFNHLREMVVTHIATEIGATIFLDYTLTSQKEFYPALMGNELIQESSPIKELEIRVNVPSGVQLNYMMFNRRLAPEVQAKGTVRSLVWKFSNVPASSKEPLTGNFQQYLPRLVFSTAKNVSSLINQMAAQPALDYSANEMISQRVNKLVLNQPDELKKLLALQKDIAQGMVTDRAEPIFVAYRARTPLEVMHSNGGNQFEKTILLATLLRQAGFTAHPVLVFPKAYFDLKASNWLQPSETLVEVITKQNGTIYLSATTSDRQSLDLKYPDALFLRVSREKNLQPIEPRVSKQEACLTGNLFIDKELKLTGSLNAKLSGQANPFLMIADDNRSAATLITGGIVAKGDDAVLVHSYAKENSSVDYKVMKEKIGRGANGYYRCEVPVLTTGFEGWGIAYLASERKDPLVIPCALTEKYDLTIEIPEGYRLVNQETNLSFENEAGQLRIMIKPEGKQVRVMRELAFGSGMFTPANYPQVLELVNTWLDRNHRMLVVGAM